MRAKKESDSRLRTVPVFKMRTESGDKTSSDEDLCSEVSGSEKKCSKNKCFGVRGSEGKGFNEKKCKDRGSLGSSHADNDFGERCPEDINLGSEESASVNRGSLCGGCGTKGSQDRLEKKLFAEELSRQQL